MTASLPSWVTLSLSGYVPGLASVRVDNPGMPRMRIVSSDALIEGDAAFTAFELDPPVRNGQRSRAWLSKAAQAWPGDWPSRLLVSGTADWPMRDAVAAFAAAFAGDWKPLDALTPQRHRALGEALHIEIDMVASPAPNAVLHFGDCLDALTGRADPFAPDWSPDGHSANEWSRLDETDRAWAAEALALLRQDALLAALALRLRDRAIEPAPAAEPAPLR